MDLSPVVNQFVVVLLYLIPFIVLASVLKSPWFKGVAGEFIVNTLARIMLNKDEYHLIKNVTLRTEDGTTQIDHVIVSRYGVFVVETKNMKGWIYGGRNQRQWTQRIYRHSNKFQNPLHQNYKHVRTIQSLLGLNDEQIHSVIVFVGESMFKTRMPENVTYGFGYIRFIKSKNKLVLGKSQIDDIVRKINEGRLSPSYETYKEHVEHARNIVKGKKTMACK